MNNKFLLIGLLVLSMNISSYAQDMFYGAKVGVNVSHFIYKGDNSFYADQSRMKVASHLGGFVEYFFDDYYAIRPELLFNVKGATFRYEDENDSRSRYVLKYLSLPVMMEYYATKRLSIALGPEFSYLLEAKDIMTHPLVQSNNGDETGSVNIYDYYKPYDLSAVAGVGYVFDNGIYLDLRYEFGVLNAFNESPLNDQLHNGTIMLSAGFSLNY